MSRNPRGGWSRHLNYSNVMSTLAVFLALASGTALAASRLRANSVSSKTVKNNSLQSADLADGSGASGADVADGSLSGADLADASLRGADVGLLGGADLADGSIGAAKLGKGAVGKANLAADALDSSNVVDGSIGSSDVGTDTVTAAKIAEQSPGLASVGTVPDTAALDGLPFNAFLAVQLDQRESPVETGQKSGVEFIIEQGCPQGSQIIAGGPANIDPGTSVVESAPKNGKWRVEIFPSAPDEFSVLVLCVHPAS